MSSINLDGGETSIIRTLGFGGAPLLGIDLLARLPNLSKDEVYGILQTLISVGYVCSSPDISGAEEVEGATFYTNPGYSKDLKEALDPSLAQDRKPRRVRRE